MFIFPDTTYPNPNGAASLAFQIIRIMREAHSQESMVIGSEDAYLVDRLKAENIPFRFVNQEEVENNIAADDFDVIVLFNNYDKLEQLSHLKCKVLIWGILAPQLTGWNRFGFETRITGKKVIGDFFTRRLLVKMHKKDALISMDGVTCDEIDMFVGYPLQLPIIPVPIDNEQLTRANIRGRANDNSLHISYIGRSDDVWKVKPAKKIIVDLSELKQYDFTVSIYTTDSKPFERELAGVLAPNITLQFHCGLYGRELRNHLKRNSDLHFSMGTAVLEGAVAGLPAILMDASIHDFPSNYRYRWIYETERCSLGRFIHEDDNEFAGMQMMQVVDACLSENSRNIIADMCYHHVVQNHSAATIVDKLIRHESVASMKDIVRNTPATWTIVRLFKRLIA